MHAQNDLTNHFAQPPFTARHQRPISINQMIFPPLHYRRPHALGSGHLSLAVAVKVVACREMAADLVCPTQPARSPAAGVRLRAWFPTVDKRIPCHCQGRRRAQRPLAWTEEDRQCAFLPCRPSVVSLTSCAPGLWILLRDTFSRD